MQPVSLLFFLVALVSCDTSIQSGEDPSSYALKSSESFKDVRGYMVYAHMDTHLNYMELHLRNLHTGDNEILLSTKNTKYTTMMPSSVSTDGHLIFIDVQKTNSKETFMLLYDLNKRTYKELNIGHSAIAGDISPDNSKLVFYSDFTGSYNFSIYYSDIKGENLFKLDCPKTSCWHPSWSKDGTKIVYIADNRIIYEYSIKTKRNKILYKLANKRKYKISYPSYYNGNVFFSKRKKTRSLSSESNTEIIKISKNKNSILFKSRDSFSKLSFLSDSLFLIGPSSNDKKNKYARIQIHNINTINSYSLTTSDIQKQQNKSPIFLRRF